MRQKLFLVFLRNNTGFLNYRDYIVNKTQTIDCLLTMFLRVRSVNQTNIMVGIRRLPSLWHKKMLFRSTGFGICDFTLGESGILLMFGIRNLNANDIQNPLLESRIHGVESRIQNFLGLPFMSELLLMMLLHLNSIIDVL